MSDFINRYSEIFESLQDSLSDGRGGYQLAFVQSMDGRWYVDIPWDDDPDDLEMVDGADAMLTYLDTDCDGRVLLSVIPSDEKLEVEENPEIEGYGELSQNDSSFYGGAHYDATCWPDLCVSEIWLCPVTLCVLGDYPQYLYIKNM